VDVEVETVVFDLAVDISQEQWQDNQDAYINQLADMYGVNASLISVTATPSSHRRRRQLSHQGLILTVTIEVPPPPPAPPPPPRSNIEDTTSSLTVGSDSSASGPRAMLNPPPPPDKAMAERAAAARAADFASLVSLTSLASFATALGVNVTVTGDVEVKTETREITRSCPKGHCARPIERTQCAQ